MMKIYVLEFAERKWMGRMMDGHMDMDNRVVCSLRRHLGYCFSQGNKKK
jgi:hypothetical protein